MKFKVNSGKERKDQQHVIGLNAFSQSGLYSDHANMS